MTKESAIHLRFAAMAAILFTPMMARGNWQITDAIPLDAVIVDLVKDPNRPCLYALNRTNSEVLFIDLELKTVTPLYVGKLPTSLAINGEGTKMYVANRGTGSGTPAGYQISVVDLNSRTKTSQFLTTYQPLNLVCGAGQRLYYNDSTGGDEEFNSAGNTGVIDLATETELGGIGSFHIKGPMVLNDTKTKLYGQYVYTPNLGEMGVFDIGGESIFKLDRHPYSPYPYGWDYNNYSISGDGNRLAYGYVLFNADNLLIQYGVFSELIHALNGDASIAFGANSIWDTTTFGMNGNATRLMRHGLSASVMCYDSANNCLYAFSQKDFSIKKLETGGVPLFPKPDASISKWASSGFVGEKVVNNTGVGQTASLGIKSGRSKVFYAQVKNAEWIDGRMRVKGPAGSKRIGIKYFNAKGRDISKAVVAGNYTTASLSYGDTAAVLMQITPGKNTKAGATAKFKLIFQAADDVSLQDIVAGSVTVK